MVDHVHPKAQRFQLALPPQLQRAHLPAGRFQFHKGAAAAGHQDNPVWDAGQTRAYELQREAAALPDRSSERLLHLLFCHAFAALSSVRLPGV